MIKLFVIYCSCTPQDPDVSGDLCSEENRAEYADACSVITDTDGCFSNCTMVDSSSYFNVNQMFFVFKGIVKQLYLLLLYLGTSVGTLRDNNKAEVSSRTIESDPSASTSLLVSKLKNFFLAISECLIA